MPLFNIQPSEKLRNIIKFSHEEACRLGNSELTVEHLILGIIRDYSNIVVAEFIEANGLDILQIKDVIEKHLTSNNKSDTSVKDPNTQLPLSNETTPIFKLINIEAQDLKDKQLEPQHLFLAIMRNDNFVKKYFEKEHGLTYEHIKKMLLGKESIDDNNYEYSDFNNPTFENTDTEDMSMSFDDRYTDDDEIERDLKNIDKENLEDFTREHKRNFPFRRVPAGNAKKSKNKTPALDLFGKDLTELARRGKLDPVVGRTDELQRIAVILSRRKKNNPVLIGEAGVGKTAVVEGLAFNIIAGKVPRVLMGKRLISLDMALMVAGTQYRGQFEERIKSLINELEKSPDVIVFIDEIHTMVGAGNSQGGMDASNMLKPALARGEIQCIGSTTLTEYRKSIESDPALERRFQKIVIEPTTEKETIEILDNIKLTYENHHLVSYTPEAIKACVSLTNRYVADRFLPDKAIDALDEAGANVSITSIIIPEEIKAKEYDIFKQKDISKKYIENREYEKALALRKEIDILTTELQNIRNQWEKAIELNRISVSAEDIAFAVSKMSGVPIQNVNADDKQQLITIEEELKQTVIGQDRAISKIVKSIRRNKVGLNNPNKPIGTFIFLGTTGVGKTHLTKMLAKFMFGSDTSLIRLDMSEYSEKHNISRLIGAPPGYIGYEEGGILTEKVRRKPYSIVLLDEIEKAHQDIFNVLLQVLGEGHLTDGLGRKVDFKNTIIIMTSNAGSKEAKDFGDGIGFNDDGTSKVERVEKLLHKALQNMFPPEFLNRIDEIIVFENITRDGITKILDIEIEKIKERVVRMNLQIHISKEVKDFLVDKAWNPELGARPITRVLQTYIEDTISEEIIKNNIETSAKLEIDLNDEKNNVTIKILYN